MIVFVVACLFVVSYAAWADSWEARRLEQRKSYDDLLKNIPLLPAKSAREVFTLGVENRRLALRSRMPSTEGDGYGRVKLDGLSELAMLRVMGGSDTPDHPPVVPSNFQFTLNDYSKQGQITTLSISREPGYFTISTSVQFPQGYSNLQFIQRSPKEDEVGSAALVISESLNEGCFNHTVEAPDFYALNQRYPDECHVWLRPLLRDLGQEQAMAPDPIVAWQVFADRWKPEPRIQREVVGLLPKLGSDDYRAREEATQKLMKLGRPGAAVMVQLDRNKLSQEQCARIDRALSAYTQLRPMEAAMLRHDLHFLIDCLYCDELALREAALERIRELTLPSLKFDLKADGEARTLAVQHIRERLTQHEHSDQDPRR